MWCYQKPGFQALLLAELQRQQQGSQFCDTLLKTDGVSVPAHSCILSALSPQMSSALSSTPPPPAGQKRLLEFRAVGACTLLHMVRLLYSGEMAGEGEKEKEEAISAAAKLGIHGLVEVTEQDRKSRGEKGEGRHVEVGVQTEPLAPEENDGQQARWRREVREGNTFLWKETLSDAEKETQTQKVQVHTAPPPQPAVSYDTIDMNALQSLGQANHQLLPPQIPFIPVSFIYPPDENHTQQHTLQEPTAALALPYASTTSSLPPFPSQATMCAAEWEDQQLEQFHGNIPGYISYFLNPDHEEEEKEEGSRGGRGRRRQRGARRAWTGERRARRPRARAAGRGRGGYMQTVDVQSVGVSTLQKMFLHRSGMRSSRPGQGGGAAGRKLFMKTRELLQNAKKSRRRGKVWEFNGDGEVIEGGAGKAQPRRRNTVQQVKQVGGLQDSYPTGRAQRTRATPNTSFSSPPMRFLNSHPLSACSPTLHHSPLPCLLSPLPSYVSPLRRPALTPHPPEHIDLLLEQVMMGLDILPNNTTCAAPSQPPLLASSSSCTYAPNKQQGSATGLLEAGAGFTQVVDVAGQAGGFSSQGEEPIVQQQEEGELNEMLEQFLQSFERQVDSGTARGAVETAHQSCTRASQPNTVQSKRRKAKTRPATPPLESLCTPPAVAHHSPISESETVQRRSRPCKPSVSPKPTEETPGEVTAPARQRDRKRENQRRSSVNKKRVRVRARVRASKPESSSDTKNKMVDDRGDMQLQQMPVVKLEMRGQLPVTVTLQGQSCRSLEVKSPTQTKRTSSSEKYQHDIRKSYPIRSRIREGDIMATVSYRHEFPLVKQLLPVRRRGRHKKNGQLPSSSNGKNSTALVQPWGPDDQLERTQEKHEEQEQPQEDGATKRRLESEGETSDDASTAKRVRFETHKPSSASEDAIDVEGVLTTSVGQCFHREEREEIPAWQEIQLREFRKGLLGESMESSCDEIIDVGEEGEWDQRPSRTPETLSLFVSPPSHTVSLGSTGSCEEDKEEDIDVTGGSSPGPDPVIIDWTGSSEEEDEDGEEDVDVVGEKADCAPSAIFISMSQDEFVNRTYQTEMLLR